MKYVGKDGLKVGGKEVWHEGNFNPDGKQDAIGYTPVNKAGDTVNGDLKVNGNVIAGTELIVGYNGTTESLRRHKWKYNGSTGYLELWRYSNQGKWELSATFPNRNTGLGGITVEGKQVATEDYVNGKVKTDVPVGAKFTDTIYSEITTAEIDAGTASTLRTITARRIKYLLDKVQAWINGLTKADVGLGSVTNDKQATKTEFDTHNSDTIKHITATERTTWNAKEPAFTKNTAFNKNFGTAAGTVCQGNDSRLSNARTPTTHTHTKSQITDMPTKLSQFTNDIGAGAGLNIVVSATEPAQLVAGDWWYKEI